jgi:hypothetical protein
VEDDWLEEMLTREVRPCDRVRERWQRLIWTVVRGQSARKPGGLAVTVAVARQRLGPFTVLSRLDEAPRAVVDSGGAPASPTRPLPPLPSVGTPPPTSTSALVRRAYEDDDPTTWTEVPDKVRSAPTPHTPAPH